MAVLARIASRPARHVATAVALIIGIAASIGAAVTVAQGEYRLAQLSFVERAKDHVQAIEVDLEHATDLLYTLRDFFTSTDHPISRGEYQSFAKSERARIDGLRDTGWAPRVAEGHRDDFERAVRADGFSGFEIRQFAATGGLVRAAPRAEYFPILYPDPLEVTAKILGFDLVSEPIRARALRRALETGRSAATPPIRLITVDKVAGGFMSYLPVFTGDPANRVPRGVVFGLFETGRMIEQILAARSRLTGLDIYIFDPDGPPGDRLIYWHSAANRSAPLPIPSEASLLSRPHWVATFRVVDQTWGAIFVPEGGLGSGLDWNAILTLAVGLIMTAMIVAYLVVSMRRTLQLELLTTSLRATTEDLREKGTMLAYMAHHDALTGLANRVSFRDDLQRALHGAGRGRGCAVLLLDLDRFKEVNDTLGHAAGDALLCQVADRLRERARQVDTVARLGGDEFAIVQADVEQPASVETLADALVAILSQPYTIAGREVAIGVSIGIALAPRERNPDIDALLCGADAALYRAKLDGRGTWRVFQPDMETRVHVAAPPDLPGALADRAA